ncbi:UvrD-like helicase carboxy-terminal domain protein [Ceratobasidium sp. AG-Ba]|nr:UvrD-like helicase carboxy-terminal domain protein [Ceratobasidium sp. AG-Ba]
MILRIEPRAQVNYQFWVKVARHLSAKGRKYRKRCIYRLPGMKPAMFPASHYSGSVDLEEDKYHDYDGSFDRDSVNDTSYTYDDSSESQDTQQDQDEATTTLAIIADLDINLPMLLDTHERAIVNYFGASVVIGRSGTGKTTALIYKMRAVNQLEGSGDSPIRQMFVTRSRVLARHVESSFRGLTGSAELAYKTTDELQAMAQRARESPQRTLAEFDTELDLRDDLPVSFSLLEDRHFPLFVSFDKLCAMLEQDLPQVDKFNHRRVIPHHKIEFDEFLEKYWPQFGRRPRSVVDPALAYSEIVGVIKGCRNALQSPNGYLSMEEYTEKLPRRVRDQLPIETRREIYSIFEQYQQLKAENYEWDHADRTREILRHFVPKEGQRLVEYLYVDEVQDNLMIDVHLLRRLCPNIQGTYWGGDTAQTVVAGSAFRIKDLTAFVHDEIHEDPQRDRWTSPSALFSIFSLTENFRSHRGIVDCAASVVDLLYRLFPNSIDRLPTESARVNGPPPVFFHDSRNDLAFFESFVLGSSDSRTGFGAQQAILVRSNAAATELDATLDGLCPVLTITDSKGLEFDDILLYNFFSHSSASPKDWKLISEAFARDFDRSANMSPALCIDLKMLYVAITRARKRCWIWDSGAVANQVKNFWLSRGLITVSSISTMIGRIGVSSTPAEWVEKGQEYFSRRIYKVAAVCFKQAGRAEDAKIASAYHQMTRAKLKFLRSNNDEGREGLAAAARSMESCAESAEGQDARHYWFHSSTCWQLAGYFVQSSDALLNGSFSTEAIELLLENNLYADGVPRLLSHWESLEHQTRERLRDQCRKFYFESRDYRSIPSVFNSDTNEQLRYARENQYIPQLKYLLKYHRRFDELAGILFEENAVLPGVEYTLAAYELESDSSKLDLAARTVIGHAHTVILLDARENDSAWRNLQRAVTLLQQHGSILESENRESLLFLNDIMASARPSSLDVEAVWNTVSTNERALSIVAFHTFITNPNWTDTGSARSLLEHVHAWNSHLSYILAVADRSASIPSKLYNLLLGIGPIVPASHGVPRSVVFENSLIIAAARRQKLDVVGGERPGEYLIRTAALKRLAESELHLRMEEKLQGLHSALLHARLTRSPYRPKHAPGLTSEFEMVRSEPAQFKRRLEITAIAMSTLDPELPIGEFVREDVAHQWIRRLHNLVYPLNGLQEDLAVVSVLNNHEDLKRIVLSYFPIAISRLDEESHRRPREFLSTLVAVLSLSTVLKPADLDDYAEEYHPIHKYSGFFYLRDDKADEGEPVPMDIVNFFSAKSADSLENVIYTLNYILDSKLELDAGLMTHLAELVTRETILELRRERSECKTDFCGMVLPRSWVKSMAVTRRTRRTVRDTDSLDEFVRYLSRLSFEFKFGGRRRWVIGDTRLAQKLDVLHMLNLRLSDRLYGSFYSPQSGQKVALNIGFNHELYFDILQALRRLGESKPPGGEYERHCAAATPFDQFNSVSDYISCAEALCDTLKHEDIVSVRHESSGCSSTVVGEFTGVSYRRVAELARL